MATLYKHGEVMGDYTRFIMYSNGQRIGYIFRKMSDGCILVRPHRTGGKWRIFRRAKDNWDLVTIEMIIDHFLAIHLDAVFN